MNWWFLLFVALLATAITMVLGIGAVAITSPITTLSGLLAVLSLLCGAGFLALQKRRQQDTDSS